MEDEEYKKLPIDEQCVHKLWQARKNGYEEVTKLFRQIDDDKSPEFAKYLGLIKKFVVDSHAVGQEKGLEATLAFVENYAHAGKTVGEVMSGVVSKCIAAPKTRTRELALQVILMYIEIEKGEAVQEELLKGMEQKNPKIVAACINAATTALKEFGSKIITLKPLVKKIPTLFSDRDKTVRDEARLMVVEMYRWIGNALRSQLNNLKPVQVAELETEFSKIEGEKPVPQRFIRSEQEKQVAASGDTEDVDGGGSDDGGDEDEPAEMDPFELADPVDILSQLPKDFYEKLEAKKWQERKEAVEALEKLVKTPKLATGDYGDLIRALKKVIEKDSNVVVVALAGRCLAGIAMGLKKKFQPYSGACVPSLLEKFKEKKQNVVSAVKEAIDAIYLSTTLEAILEDVIEALGSKNPSVRYETQFFLARSLTKTQPSAINKKMLKALCAPLLKNINESDPTVRDSSAEALGTLMKLVGEKTVGPFLVELEKDQLKMSKIKECCDKAVITVKIIAPKKERPATAPTKTKTTTSAPKSAPAAANKTNGTKKKPAAINSATVTRSKGKVVAKKIEKELLSDDESEELLDEPETHKSNQDLLSRVDISNQITDSLLNELDDKSWKVRTESLAKISQIIQDVKFIKPNLGDLPQALCRRLADSNKQVAQSALNLCEVIAKAMGSPARQYIKVFFPVFLKNWGDNKPQLRTAAKEAIQGFADHCGYKEFFENEMIADGLKSGTPQLKIEMWEWLADVLLKVPVKAIPKEEIIVCIPILYSHLEDRMSEIRANSSKAILGVMTHVGYEAMVKQLEKLKPASQFEVKKKLDNERGNLPIQTMTKKSAEREEKTVRGTKPVANSKNAVKSKGAASKNQTTTNSKKKEEEIDTSPLLVVNNMKHQRTIDESKLKVLKWNFTTPREEFVDLLREQMLAANVNKNLISNMFHNDFGYHIKALESLMDDLNDNTPALIANLDLILKWLTLRFFDTNPSVMFKGLEYLHSVFTVLTDANYKMLENEAASFLPYLVMKIGDAKFCNGVRSLVKQICHVYPVARVFTYIMEGIKSKNARQRAECLEVMGSIIQDYGINVLGASPTPVLKEVAKQISDKDKSVRNAALNCMVEAYNILGEKIYKMIGNILGKDLALLEGRIKHSKRTSVIRRDPSIPQLNVTVIKEPEVVNVEDNGDIGQQNEEEEEEEDNLPPMIMPPKMVHEVAEPTGPYSLDPDLLQRLDNLVVPVNLRKTKEFDLDFLKDDVQFPTLSPESMKAKTVPLSPPKPLDPNLSISRLSDGRSPQNSPKKQDPLLAKCLHSTGSPDPNVAVLGLQQVIDYLQSSKSPMMLNYENDFIRSIVTQLKHLRSQNPVENPIVAKLYRSILTAIDAFYHNKNFGQNVSVENLKDIVDQLIHVLVDSKLEHCPDGDAYIRVINLHCVKIIEKSDHTKIICALVKLIHECIRMDNQPRHTDLVMKCLWRVIKLMPNWGEDIDYDSVLLEVHNFLKEFPSTWWKNKPMDTALRTIKTILHSCVKIRGAAIMLHFGKIPNHHESEIESYILKLIKTMKLEPVPQPQQPKVPFSFSRATHTMLTDIFQKIGNKDETKEGLTLLYDFMQKHPEADIEPFLKKSSKFFQDYIQNGLKEIEESRKSKSTMEEVVEKASELISSSSENVIVIRGPEYWENRLKMWNKRIYGNEGSDN